MLTLVSLPLIIVVETVEIIMAVVMLSLGMRILVVTEVETIMAVVMEEGVRKIIQEPMTLPED
jgi:hypothetical protein